MEKIVSLSKRRGFVFPSSEIYGGLSSAWDYGPFGVELKNNIQKYWWQTMTRGYDNVLGLDAAIMMHPKTWEASGHVENFSDPLVDCKKCKNRFREDKMPPENQAQKRCPSCAGELTEARQFNLMFSTHMGSVEDQGSRIYLRPETAQGIFVNFKNVVDTCRMSIPFGIAQTGKAFRNEITTKNFIFRTCEFEQMEMQFFVKPGEEDRWFEFWKEERLRYYDGLGIRQSKLRFKPHGPDELAHYAKAAFDIEYRFPFAWEELEGIHSRGDYDLSRHGEFCGKPVQYRDQTSGERYVPYVIETSAGLSRSVLVALTDAYTEEKIKDSSGKEDIRTVLRFHPRIAPVTVGIFPLMKKDGLPEQARELRDELKYEFSCLYDQQGAIGRRYRRMDELGTPFCLTVDYESKTRNDVTLRFRDSMEQVRVPVGELKDFLRKAVESYKRQEEPGDVSS